MRTLVMAALVSSFIVAGCGPVNQATGQRDLSFISPQQEAQIGAEQHPKMVVQFGGEYDDPALQAYVEGIGRKLSQVSEKPNIQWTFTILNSPVVNAFALPGGYVYVSRGLMGLANSEAELAGVIGHEIGHVTARHGANRITRGQLVGVGATLVDILVNATTGVQGAGQAASIAGQAYVASYSRDQEFQADALGVRYLGRGGYDQEAQSRFLDSLSANTDLMMRLAGQDDKRRQFDFFATHPNTPERVIRALELARADGDQGGRVARAAHLAQIDGMIFGDDPAQGFVVGQDFIHTELDLRFTFPDGVRLVNQPTAVRGVGDNRSIIFDGDRLPSGASLDQYVRNTWLAQNNVTPQAMNARRINGMRTVTAEAPVRVNGQPAFGYFAAIEHSPGRVYRFVVLEGGEGTRAGYRDFEQTIQSFNRVQAADRARVSVKRLDVVTVRSGDTISGLAQRMDVDRFKEQQFRVLNGLKQGDILQAGQQVKLVVDTPLP